MDAFVFDAYGTLFDVHSVVRRCEALWPGKGAALSQAWRTKQLEYTWQRSLMGRYRPFSEVTRDALQWACESLGLALREEDLAQLMADYLELDLFPEVTQALGRLRGRKTAILSNGSPDMLEPLVRHSGLALDAVISVDSLRIYKPAPAVYELAMKTLGVADKTAITFVSSNGWDAIGAKAFGFRVFWVNRSGAPLDRMDVAPDRIGRTLLELG